MTKKELNGMEIMMVAGGRPVGPNGKPISPKEYEELVKQRKIKEMEADGFTYTEEDGIRVITKTF